MHSVKSEYRTEAGIIVPGSNLDVVLRAPRTRYDWQCFDADGNLVWEDVTWNVVTDVGATNLLEQYFRGSAYTAAWFIGLVSSTSFTGYNAADTMASHGGWTEFTGYSQSTRVAAGFGSAASAKSLVANAASVFSINAAGTVKGSFLVTNSTKSGTTGVLYAASNFTQGDRPVDNGYTVNVTPTVSVT